MREDDLFHVVVRLKILVRNLTAPLVTNEQSYLTEEQMQGRRSIENPQEHEHWVLNRRGGGGQGGMRRPGPVTLVAGQSFSAP